MNLEMDENTSFSLVATVLILGTVSGFMYGCRVVEQTKVEAIKAGLVEGHDASGNRIWIKSKPE